MQSNTMKLKKIVPFSINETFKSLDIFSVTFKFSDLVFNFYLKNFANKYWLLTLLIQKFPSCK